MFAGTISHAGALITAIVVLNGTAILRGGEAAADPNQDDQFLALLHQKEIPALTNVPSLIATAHKVCRKLDGGMPVNDVVDAMMDNALNVNATAGQTPLDRLTRTFTRFITAAVEAYCPYIQPEIASVMAMAMAMANRAPGSYDPAHWVGAYGHHAVNSGRDLRDAWDMVDIPAARQELTRTGVVQLPHLMGGNVIGAGRYGL